MFVVAHRVNSVAAARSRAVPDVSHVELDVRLTGGRIVLSHFQKVLWAAWLERDNARLRLGSGPPRDALLDDVLALLPHGVTVVFDPKDREPAVRAALARVLAERVAEPSRHVVSSRSVDDLAAFGAAGFRTWQTLDSPAQIAALTGTPLPFDGVTVRHRALSVQAVQALHGVTGTVVAWTVNSTRRAQELAGYGVDGVTTDNPAVMAAMGQCAR